MRGLGGLGCFCMGGAGVVVGFLFFCCSVVYVCVDLCLVVTSVLACCFFGSVYACEGIIFCCGCS